jgi:hypothetical protein
MLDWSASVSLADEARSASKSLRDKFNFSDTNGSCGLMDTTRFKRVETSVSA